MTAFQKSDPELPSSPPVQNLKFEREDWALFRTIEGLQQRAGVPKERLRRLVLKELADNGLDNDADVRVGDLPGGGYFVEDDGTGIDPDEVARLFSIARPMVSTKLWRLPSRGALGNGLRVVAGAVLASEGSLTVLTRDQRIELRPERDGTTTIVSTKPADFPVGTRIEISFGPTMPADEYAFGWAQIAIAMSGKSFAGKTSPWWYDAPTFHELLYASGARPVRDLIANLDGCSGAKAGEIVAAAGLGRLTCESITREQAERLLQVARSYARQVNPSRLSGVGPVDAFGVYACQRGDIDGVPFLVEAWAKSAAKTALHACVNRTPVTGRINASRDKRDIDAFGCGLRHTIATAPKDKHFYIRLNIITPYMPITSDGKAPNLEVFLDPIAKAAGSAVRKAYVPNSANGTTQKSIVLENLDAAIAKVGDDGKYRFNQRQLLYVLRPIVREELDKELTLKNFTDIITDYEDENGEIEGMYREPRGSIYHPHRDQTITLGTLMVEEYDRPAWTFNKLLYIEKEGFSEALKEVRWGERHDCAIMSSKGFSTRAARDLIDKLAEHDEPVTVFCVHDADAYGTMIYQTLQEATKARGARKVAIINLGLEPWEADEMGLETEDIEEKDKRRPVADYVSDDWTNWLQEHRVELNAMTTPQFIEWLDGKMVGHEKLTPPVEVIAKELEGRLASMVRTCITERILAEAGLEERIREALSLIERPGGDVVLAGIKRMFEGSPESEWREHIHVVVEDCCKGLA
jgi:Topoisomerase 6 subunit A/Spo11, Toprim domain